MIGLDTNILVRYFGQDDPIQTARATAIIVSLSADKPGWISQAAILELVWVLTRHFRQDRFGVVAVLDALRERTNIVIENKTVFDNARKMFQGGNADFADCLISCSGQAAGCSTTLTFDRKAAKSAGMTLA